MPTRPTTNSSTALDVSQTSKYLKRQIDQLERKFTRIAQTITKMKDEIAQFQQQYDQQVKPLHDRLDELDRLLYKYKSISEHVDSVFSYDEAADVFESAFAEQQAHANAEARRKDARRQSQRREAMSVEDTAELKRLYRDLARIFHPDKTSGDEHMMKQINKAYTEGDLATLRELNRDHHPTQNQTTTSLHHRLEAVQTQLILLQREKRALLRSDMYRMKQRFQRQHAAGTNYLDQLTTELTSIIHTKEAELEKYKHKFGLSV